MKEIGYKNATSPDGVVKVAEAGTAGNPDAGVTTVQGIAGGTPVPMSLASVPLPTGAALEGGNLASIRTAVERIPAAPATEDGNLASIRTAVERIPTSPATEGGNLAGILTAVNKIPASPAQDGTDATGAVAPAGATGIRGWLSGSYATLVSILAKLNASIAVTGTIEVANDSGSPLPVLGPITDAQARATPLPVLSTPSGGSRVDHSGAITVANTAQAAIPANAARRGFCVMNLHATDKLWFNDGGVATTGPGSTPLAPGMQYESPVGAAGVAAISVLSATATHPFTAKEW